MATTVFMHRPPPTSRALRGGPAVEVKQGRALVALVALVARVAAALIVALLAVVAVGDRGGPRPWGAPAGLAMGGRRAQRRLASPRDAANIEHGRRDG